MFTSLFCIFPLQDVSAKPELDLTDGLGLYSSLNGNNSLRMCAFIMITRCYIFIWKYSIIYFIVYYFRNISLRMCIHYDHQILHIYFNRSLPAIWAFICFSSWRNCLIFAQLVQVVPWHRYTVLS